MYHRYSFLQKKADSDESACGLVPEQHIVNWEGNYIIAADTLIIVFQR